MNEDRNMTTENIRFAKHKKVPLKIEVTQVIKVTYGVKDNSILPDRQIEEFWSLDGERIGKIDILDQFSLINFSASSDEYSADK